VAWEADLVLMTRVLMNDYTEPQKYSDTYLRQVLVCAGILVRKDIELPYAYEFDISAGTMTPDPIVSQDTIAQALLPLRAAAMLNQGAYITAIGQGIRVRDGDSQIDTTVGFKGYRDIIEIGPTAAYNKLVWQLQAQACPGAAVMGAYRAPGDPVFDSVAYFYDEFAVRLGTFADRRSLRG
jgi:hypothetical protein